MVKTKTTIILLWLSVFASGLALSSKCTLASPSVLKVPEQYSTIQKAIDASTEGDIIQVSAGVYYEHLMVDKSISLVGENKTTTIVDGNGEVEAITIFDSSFVTVTAFTIRNAAARGIEIADSTWITISGNTISNNDVGVDLTSGSFNTIVGNIITSNKRTGIGMSDSFNNTLSGNSLQFNGNQNIGLDWSSNNTIIGNIVSSSSNGTVLSHQSTYNTIVGNTFSNNSVGIRLMFSIPNNNTIYRNSFINNTIQVRSDNPTLNKWNSAYPVGGNFWSDYDGVDLYTGRYQNQTGSDGIGDMSYTIDSINEDRYPLMEPGKTIEDVTPPVTSDNYDDLWHSTDFNVALTASDDLTGVSETSYKINSGQTRKLADSGQPLITTEGANNTLEYWSVDWAGNEEIPHRILKGIKLDKTSPLVSLKLPKKDEVTSSTINAAWSGSDSLSGIDHYEVRLDNGGWIDVATNTSKIFAGLSQGTHVIQVKAVDKAHRSATSSVAFTVESNVGLPYATEMGILALLGGIALVVIYYYHRRKRKSLGRRMAR